MSGLQGVLNAETIVSIGLVIALLLAICNGTNELSMSIASGLIGYIGRGKLAETRTEGSK